MASKIVPRIAITAGDPAGIGPEIAAKAAADAGVRAVCEPIIFGSDAPANVGEVSAASGRAAYDTIVRAVDARHQGRRRRHRHGAGEQAGLCAGGTAVEGPHRSARASLRHVTRGDDVSCAGIEGRADHRARAPQRGARADHAGTGRPDDRSHPRGAAAVRGHQAAPGHRRAQPARRRRWRARRRRRSRARAGGGRGARAWHRRERPVSRRHRVRARVQGRVRLRDRVLSRPGPDSGEAAGLRACGERHHRPADHPHLGRSRHRVRHRGQGRGRSRQHDRSGEAGGAHGGARDDVSPRRRR